MIRFVRKHLRSLAMGVIAFVVCRSMLGFGVDFFNPQRGNYAIKIDDHEISHSDFFEQKRLVQESNRRMLGELYEQYEKTLSERLNQELVDTMISDVLLDKFAKEHDLFTAPNAVRARLTQLFSGQIDQNRYRAFLNQINKTALEFEGEIEREALKEQLIGIFQNISQASLGEAQALYTLDETAYDVAYVQFKSEDYVSKVEIPSDQILLKIYEERAAELEAPAEVNYDFVLLDSAQFKNTVEISPEDIEFYYSENLDLYSNPEQGHFRHIRFTYAAKASPEEMSQTKLKAEEVLAKLKAGDSFEALAKQFSDDFPTAINGGDLGWLEKGKMSKEFDSAAFKLSPGQNSELVSTDAGFHIIRMEEFREKKAKPLEEVRAQIEEAIRNQEAPAYLAVKSQEFFDQWIKSAQTLSEFAAANALKVEGSGKNLQAGSDPNLLLAGLTDKIIEMSDQAKQLVELKDNFALVQVKEFKPAETPPFEQLKAKLLEDYKKSESLKLAQKAAVDFIELFKTDSAQDLPTFAKSKALNVESSAALKRRAKATGFLASDQARKAIFSAGSVKKKPAQPISNENSYFVLQVSAQHEPALQGFEEKKQQYLERASQSIEQALMVTLVNQLKAKAQIDVAPDILSN